jgi:hypothetical protein
MFMVHYNFKNRLLTGSFQQPKLTQIVLICRANGKNTTPERNRARPYCREGILNLKIEFFV